jgi:hypothetical protein
MVGLVYRRTLEVHITCSDEFFMTP